VALAILTAARDRGADVPSATGFRSITGRGVEATVDGQPVAVGGPALLRERNLTESGTVAARTAEWRHRGAGVLHVVRDGRVIGAGTDVAIESAGVVLASSDPRSVLGVIRLSRASYRKMTQNLAWGAGYNLIAIPLAAGVLSFAGITLSPAVGAILMSVS